MTDHISCSIEGTTLVIRLNRLQAKNALSLAMYRKLTQALQQLDDTEQLTSAVIVGSEQCFSAGNDLKDFLAGGELNREHPTVAFLHQLALTQKPIIAAVAGPAIGIGTTMLLHCDLVVAASNSVLQMPFAKLGLCPEAASSVLLTKQIGYQQAFELMVLGSKFDAQQAFDLGLLNKVVEPGQVEQAAMLYAEQLAQLPTDAVQTSKALMKSDKAKVQNIIEMELKEFQRLLDSEQTKQIISGFFAR